MPKEQKYPLIFASAFSQEAGAALNVASADGLIQMSRILRSAVDLWRAHHQHLMLQGHGALDATNFLLRQTEAKHAQTQVPPQPAPSPFAPPPMNGGQRAHP